jgi:hypothetical protein
MTKRLIIIFSAFMCLLMASTTSIAAAQATPNVPAIAKSVNKADPQSLLAGLKTPIGNKSLPAGFSDAKYVNIGDSSATPVATPTGDLDASCLYDATGLSGTEGAAAYSLKADTTTLNYLVACGSINYVLFQSGALGKTPVADFKKGVEQGIGNTGEGTPDANGGVAKVTDVKVANEDAVLLTYTLHDSSGVVAVVAELAIPVGNMFIISEVSVADTTAPKTADVDALVKDLTVAAITYLGTVAKAAQ